VAEPIEADLVQRALGALEALAAVRRAEALLAEGSLAVSPDVVRQGGSAVEPAVPVTRL
jgi:hypothetical protein